jgi:catechol 2,3-dioxygenase-like lactoylglutathione lyase family enzyme
MPASAISHIAICVGDVDRSLAFYRDMLGFRVISDRVQDTTTGGLPHVYKNRHNQRRIVYLSYGEGDDTPRIVMTGHPGDTPDGEAIKLDQIGISHMSFTVPNVAELIRELLSKGAQTSGPPDAFKDASGHTRTVFFLDPDGILVQFDEGGE